MSTMRLVTALLSAGLLAHGPPTAHAADSCGCDDAKDLRVRIGMAHAALDELKQALGQTSSTAKVDEIPPGESEINKTRLKKFLKQAIEFVQDSDRSMGEGETFATCAKRVDAPTACLTDVMEKHEQFHVEKCEAYKKAHKLGLTDDPWRGRLLTDYIKEEIESYGRELADALARLRALPASCRPAGWVGTIRFTQFVESRIDLNTPPRPGARYADPTVENTTDLLRRWGTVYYGTNSTGYSRAERVTTIRTVSGMLESCTGGLNPKPPDRHRVNTTTSKMESDAHSKTMPVVVLDLPPNGLQYTITVSGPGLEGKGKYNYSEESSGGCNDTKRTNPQVWSPMTIGPLDAMTVGGRKFPTDRYIGGSQTFDLSPARAFDYKKTVVPGVSANVNTVTVYWHLYRHD